MVRDGWKADPKQGGRLVHDNLRGDGTRVNMAEHEAVAFHFKHRPLTARRPVRPIAPTIASVPGSKEIRGTAQEPAPTEKLER